jgi:hypothetical protein
MSFIQKLQLVEAMGLFPMQLIRPIEAINSLRNKVAHDLDFELTNKAVADIRNVTPKSLRDIVMTTEGRPKGPVTFSELMNVLVLQAEVVRQQQAIDRLLVRKGEIRLRSVLYKTPGAVYRE